MARILVSELFFETVIGVYDWERKLPQRLSVSLELTIDSRAAVANDAIGDAVDYDKLSKSIIDWAKVQSFHLVESLAVGILRLTMKDPMVLHSIVTVSKYGAIKDAKQVSVRVNSDEDL